MLTFSSSFLENNSSENIPLVSNAFETIKMEMQTDSVGYYKLPKDSKERARFIKEYKKEIVNDEVLISVAKKVKELCKKFPIP